MKKLEEIFKGIDFEEMKKIHTKKVVEYLYPFIQNAKDEGYKLKDIYQFIVKNGITITKSTFESYLTHLNKKNKAQKINIQNMNKEDKKMENSKVIAMVNFKGGVGKSTIANLLDFKDKIIINLDEAQNAEKMNISNTTANFYQLKEEYGIDSIEEAIKGAFEVDRNPVILDTPGDIKEFIKILSYVDFFIVPFTPGDRSEETTITTIAVINEVLENYSNRKDKWCIVLNKYVLEEQLKELDIIYEKAKEILGDRLICKTALKYSGVVPTIEKKKQTIDDLLKISPIAYGTFKRRVKELNKNIKNALKG